MSTMRCSASFCTWHSARVALAVILSLLLTVGCYQNDQRAREADAPSSTASEVEGPFVQILGIGQDGGVPQAGNVYDRRWDVPERRELVSSLALVDAASTSFWMFDATPDLPEQLYASAHAVSPDTLKLKGVFLTHAHIGHYTGLMFFGHEAMGAKKMQVFAMPRMSEFLASNGPWGQLIRYENIEMRTLADGVQSQVSPGLSVKPFLVPHRQEYSEVVGYRITGPRKSLLFIPDIDSWGELDQLGTGIESLISDVDYAFLDGTFFENGELPGRDMSGFPHPFIRTSMNRFSSLPLSERNKIYFIHLNHSNPALDRDSSQRRELEAAGMHVAWQGQRVEM